MEESKGMRGVFCGLGGTDGTSGGAEGLGGERPTRLQNGER